MASITVRHAEPEDYLALNRICACPNVIWGTVQLPFQPTQAQRDWFASKPDTVHNLVACSNSEVVGSISLTVVTRVRRKHTGHLGMMVHDDWQGQGIGSALLAAALDLADNWLALKRVELFVWTDNVPAITLYEKFGFVVEGTHQHYAFRAGEYIDAHSMGRIRRRAQ
jgi:putative acetyltransferase